MKHQIKNKLFSIAFSLLSFPLLLGSAECMTRVKSGGMIERKIKPELWTNIYRIDNELGWTFKSDLKDAKDIMHPIINTDSRGFRTSKLEKYNDFQTVVFGDSFTAGSEVTDEETYPFYLSGFLNEGVLNAGCGGYGFDQIYLSLKKYIKYEKPKRIITSIILNDIERLSYSVHTWMRKPYFTINKNSLTYHKPEPILSDLIKKKLREKSLFYRIYFSNPIKKLPYKNTVKNNQLEISEKIFYDLGETSKKENIPIYLIIHPFYKDNDIELSKKLEEIAIKNGLYCLNLEKEYYNFNSKDLWKTNHMNGDGNKLIAERIYNFIKQ